MARSSVAAAVVLVLLAVGLVVAGCSESESSDDPGDAVVLLGVNDDEHLPVATDLAPEGLGYVDTRFNRPDAEVAAPVDGPWAVYSEQVGGVVVAWYYHGAGAVPPGTALQDAKPATPDTTER